ncbi:hypothetical protein HDU98_009447 [Podochytrium sp. JEL0797]|nr:hypothetical protein HDU98_009447 [Podochytrium sp. JEL0797]
MDYRSQKQQQQQSQQRGYYQDDGYYNGGYPAETDYYGNPQPTFEPQFQQHQQQRGFNNNYQQQQQQQSYNGRYVNPPPGNQAYQYPPEGPPAHHLNSNDEEYDSYDEYESTVNPHDAHDPYAYYNQHPPAPPPVHQIPMNLAIPESALMHRRNSSPTKSSFSGKYSDPPLMRNGTVGSGALGYRPTKEQRLGLPPKKEASSVWTVLNTYLCCCVPKRPLYRIVCLVVVLVVCIVLGVLGYMFFPQFPVIKVNSIDLGNLSNGAFNFSIPDGSGNLNHLNIQLSMQMSISTYNPNSYGLQVDVIDLTAQMMVNTTYVFNPLKTQPLTSFASLVSAVGPPPSGRENFPNYHPSNSSTVGTGRVSSIYFPAKKTVNYTMNFLLNYTPDPVVGLLADPTVLELADACGITSRYSPPGRPMRIHYQATSVVAALKPIGYAPTIQNDILINCPVSSSQIQAIIAAAQTGQSPIAALQGILGGGSGATAAAATDPNAAPSSVKRR